MNLFLVRHSAAAFGNVRRDRDNCSANLVTQRKTFVLRKSFKNTVNLNHIFSGFLPSIQILKRVFKFFHTIITQKLNTYYTMSNNHSTITNNHAVAERKRYISAFNDTMIKIWKEQITLLGVIDTGMLLGSTHAISMKMDSNATEAELSQEFREYGLWQGYGVGLLIRLNKLSHICTASRRPTPACLFAPDCFRSTTAWLRRHAWRLYRTSLMDFDLRQMMFIKINLEVINLLPIFAA